jgi:signal peptidase I
MTLWWAIGLVALAAVGAAAAAVRWRRVIARVEGESMQPTLYAGDRLLVRRGAAGLHTGCVVVVEQPMGGKGWWRPGGRRPAVGWRRGGGVWSVKRVVAVAGEPVPYDRAPVLGGGPGSLVPLGQLVVLGDNAAASFDSRAYGYVPVDRVLGVVLRVLSPRSSRPGAPGSLGTGPAMTAGGRDGNGRPVVSQMGDI